MKAWGCGSVTEHLLSICQILSSSPRTTLFRTNTKSAWNTECTHSHCTDTKPALLACPVIFLLHLKSNAYILSLVSYFMLISLTDAVLNSASDELQTQKSLRFYYL